MFLRGQIYSNCRIEELCCGISVPSVVTPYTLPEEDGETLSQFNCRDAQKETVAGSAIQPFDNLPASFVGTVA